MLVNEEYNGKKMSTPLTYGNGFPPGKPRQGSSNGPGLAISTSLPKGDANPVVSMWKVSGVYSYDHAYDARTEVRPSPFTSHPSPSRGPMFPHCLWAPVFPGNPESPG